MIKVHSYESMGTFDGPGLRLVVFLQGCNFRCLYCANADTITTKGGKETEDEEILRMALSQKSFFGKKGGVTFSGGEPTLQAKELISTCKLLKENGIHVCLDTNGSILNDDVKELLQYIDMVLLDVKQFNPTRHETLTERSNDNTLKMLQYLNEINKPVWLRYVLVPGYSDFTEDIEGLGQFAGPLSNIERVEILPYHTLGKHKYEHLNKPYLLNDVKENTPEQLEKAKATFEKFFNYVCVN
ncbi:MAG: pyruvate formate-lyase-activating protein [Marinifilaceae bacterium]